MSAFCHADSLVGGDGSKANYFSSKKPAQLDYAVSIIGTFDNVLKFLYGNLTKNTEMYAIGNKHFLQSSSVKGRSRTVLTKQEVIEIFKLKQQATSSKTSTFQSEQVCKMFGVSPKTIRDIWVGRTWYRATHQLDPARKDSSIRLGRQPGRPKGSKDARPRVRKGQNSMPTKIFESDSFFGSAMPYFHGLCAASSIIPEKVQSLSSVNPSTEDLLSKSDLPTNFKAKSSEFIDPFHDDWPYW